MTDIQRFPAGLLELLGAKISGWTPGDIARDLTLSVDMLEMFGMATVRQASAQNAAAAEGDSVTVTVPDTEWWLLYALDMTYVKTATATLFVGSLRIAPSGINADWVHLASGPVPLQVFGSTAGTGASPVCAFVPSRPWLLPPGTRLFGRCDILGTDATANIYINYRYTPLA